MFLGISPVVTEAMSETSRHSGEDDQVRTQPVIQVLELSKAWCHWVQLQFLDTIL